MQWWNKRRQLLSKFTTHGIWNANFGPLQPPLLKSKESLWLWYDIVWYLAGQTIIFHQPRFAWNSRGIPFLNATFWSEVVFSVAIIWPQKKNKKTKFNPFYSSYCSQNHHSINGCLPIPSFFHPVLFWSRYEPVASWQLQLTPKPWIWGGF